MALKEEREDVRLSDAPAVTTAPQWVRERDRERWSHDKFSILHRFEIKYCNIFFHSDRGQPEANGHCYVKAGQSADEGPRQPILVIASGLCGYL